MNTLPSLSNIAGGSAAAMPIYAPPSTGAPIDLHLDANEGPSTACNMDLARLVSLLSPEGVRRYPSSAALERVIAERWNVLPSQVLLTAGGDEAIDRACRVLLAPGREIIVPVPTFEMIPRYARLARAEVVTTAWPEGPYPIEQVIALVNDLTAMIVVVTPNNPTGAVATAGDLKQLANAAPNAVLLVDCAYAEFADEDLTAAALELPNVIVIRTFSKAFAMAGLRVGYAIGSEQSLRAMRAVGSPFPVSGLSLALAEEAFIQASTRLPEPIHRVRLEREQLAALLTQLGARPTPTQGNFVLAEFENADWVWRALAGLGISVRRFVAGSGLERSLRITCPGREPEFARLCRGLRAAHRPQALLFSMDGVIADFSELYRSALTQTAASFGVTLTPNEMSAIEAKAVASDDCGFIHSVLNRRGLEVSLEEVTRRVGALCRGSDGAPGLSERAEVVPDRSLLERLADRLPLAILTGRSRQDCELVLARFKLTHLFSATVCKEDGPATPDPASVLCALERLNVEAAWNIAHTPDGIVAARAAGVVPIGIASPIRSGKASSDSAWAMERAGAARILGSLTELEGMLR